MTLRATANPWGEIRASAGPGPDATRQMAGYTPRSPFCRSVSDFHRNRFSRFSRGRFPRNRVGSGRVVFYRLCRPPPPSPVETRMSKNWPGRQDLNL